MSDNDQSPPGLGEWAYVGGDDFRCFGRVADFKDGRWRIRLPSGKEMTFEDEDIAIGKILMIVPYSPEEWEY